MAQGKGSSARLLMGKETTWGTTPTFSAGDTMVIPFASETITGSQAKENNPHLNSSRLYGKPVRTRAEVGGDISLMLNPLGHGRILHGLLGPAVTTGAGPYVHTFKPGVLPSWSFEKGFTDISEYIVYAGMYVGKLSGTIKDSGFVACSTTLMGKSASPSTATSFDSAPTALVDNPFDCAAAAVAITEGGSAIGIATEMTFDIDNELDGDNFTIANQGQRGSITTGKCLVTGQLTAFFENETLLNKAINSTESAIVVTLQHGTGDGSAGNEQLVLTFPEIEYDRQDPQVGDSGGVLVVLPFRAYYVNNADATSFKAVLKNTVVAYT